MVTNNNSEIDHLPYIDIPINGEERAIVEQEIRRELNRNEQYQESQRNGAVAHPLVNNLISSESQTHQNSLVMEEIQRYEQEDEEEDEEVVGDDEGRGVHGPIIEGIDMTKYDINDPNFKYLESLYYTVNESSNLEMLLQNSDNLSLLNAKYLKEILDLESELNDSLAKKRKHMDDVNVLRKKRQLEFKSVNDYLNERWKEGIKSVVDMGVESLRED